MQQNSERIQMKVILGGNQMSLIRDTEEVIKFLEFAGRKHILSEHAVNCRLTACNTLFSVLNEEEDSLEYILGNLDVLIHRFRNRNPNVQPSTLKVYKSRVKGSLEDFKAWSADPFLWERSVTERAKIHAQDRKREKKKKTTEDLVAKAKSLPSPESGNGGSEPTTKQVSNEKKANELQSELRPQSQQIQQGGRSVSFPIRDGFLVQVNLPEDGLTLKEFKRLGLFLYPYCTDIDLERAQWTEG